MADYRPETKVYLCEQVPLDDTYTDTLDFADKAAQSTYFASKATHKYTNLSYQRVNCKPARCINMPCSRFS